MILFEKPEIPFEYTAKGTPRRPAIVDAYEEDINAAYEAFENTNGADIPVGQISKAGSFSDMLSFVRDVVNANIPSNVGDDDDIFRTGGGDRYVHLRPLRSRKLRYPLASEPHASGTACSSHRSTRLPYPPSLCTRCPPSLRWPPSCMV